MEGGLDEMFDAGMFNSEPVDEDIGMPVRVKKIFAAMDSPQRLRILRALNSTGPLSYSDLKKLAGFQAKNESGKFAYHLRSLDAPGLVTPDKNSKRYSITNLGKMALSLAKQIEEKSIHESSRMYVRTSEQSMEEFNSHRITQSLVREGGLPTELAHRITEEVESRIYKYQTNHLTGPLIRELVNAVLLERGHEDYRSRMTRLGVPAHDLREILTDAEGAKAGSESIILEVGRRIFVEYLLTNALSKDVSDMYLTGKVHISNLASWMLVPDTLFVRMGDVAGLAAEEVGMPELVRALNGISWEASDEIVMDGVAETGMQPGKLASAMSMVRGPSGTAPTSFQVPLESGQAVPVLEAYGAYARAVTSPSMGLTLDPQDADVEKFAPLLSDIARRGGRVTVATGRTGGNCLTDHTGLAAVSKMHSLAINLPGIAYESDNDETYFRAKMVMRMEPLVSALESRRKGVADITRRGLNPFLASREPHNEKESVGLLINLIGMDEAVSDIMEYKDAHPVRIKTLDSAASALSKRGQKAGLSIGVCMLDSDGGRRMMELDEEAYGKDKVPRIASGQYGRGVKIDVRQTLIASQLEEMVSQTQEMASLLNGALYTELSYHKETPAADITKCIEALAGRINFAIRPARRDSS